MGFFSEHGVYTLNAKNEPRNLNRFDQRFEHIVRPHLDRIRGKRVLDLAAHDGHWSWAALQCGAAHVHAVEGRRDLVDRGREFFDRCGFERGRYEFTCSDIFEALEGPLDVFDTVFCLGIFYHVLDHHRLLRLMTASRPEAVVLDTAVIPEDGPLIRLHFEATGAAVNAIPRSGRQASALVGRPSREALELLAEEVGYAVRYVPWDFGRIPDATDVEDYRAGHRVTALLTPADATDA